ncbi:IclR family transcriptional regulator [Knoellia pratensis]|uniref:IclR family transcriptional regulator n=1 Tax=Knoellia pratensis TaxID=3404796 RepID=UPI00361C615C
MRSLERAFGILEAIADAGGTIALSQLSLVMGLPPPTVHRLSRTLVDLGYLRQERSRMYSLGPQLIPLGEATAERIAIWARPHMFDVAQALGESVALATLDGDAVLYTAQVQHASHSMRMFTDIGTRARPHATAAGKAILAKRTTVEVQALLARTGMPPHTTSTLTTVDAFLAELDGTREHGFAMEDGEQELGVRSVAVAFSGAPFLMALSVSAPVIRMTDEVIARAAALLQLAADRICDEFQRGSPRGESRADGRVRSDCFSSAHIREPCDRVVNDAGREMGRAPMSAP